MVISLSHARAWAALFLIGALGLPVIAQAPKTNPPKVAAPVYKEDRPRDVSIAEQTAAKGMFRSGVVTDKTLFDKVFTYRCAQLTWQNKNAAASDIRKRLKSDLHTAERGAKPEAHDRLVHLVLNAMAAIVQDPGYHPSARLNAMLLLGDLNARTVEGGATKLVPHPEALSHLLLAVGTPPTETNDVEDVVRCAALQGLARHAKAFDAKSQNRPSILKTAIALAASEAVPTGRTKEIHDWIRCRAVLLIGLAAKPAGGSADEPAIDLLHALIANRTAPVKLRLDASAAVGGMHAGNPDDALAAVQLSQSLGSLAVDLLKSEVVQYGGRQWGLRREGSREILTHGLKKISLALSTVEAPADSDKPTSQATVDSQTPSAVQHLRTSLTAMLSGINDYQLHDAVIAHNSAMAAGSLETWLDRDAVVKTIEPIGKMLDDDNF